MTSPAPTSPAPTSPAATSQAPILLIDADPQRSAVLTRLLARYGHTTVLARDTAEALQIARAAWPAAALVGTTMRAALRALRALPGGTELPAVLLADAATPASTARRGEVFLQEPFDFAELLALLPPVDQSAPPNSIPR